MGCFCIPWAVQASSRMKRNRDACVCSASVHGGTEWAGYTSGTLTALLCSYRFRQVGKGRDVGLGQITGFVAKISMGNGMQARSREVRHDAVQHRHVCNTRIEPRAAVVAPCGMNGCCFCDDAGLRQRCSVRTCDHICGRKSARHGEWNPSCSQCILDKAKSVHDDACRR